MREEIKVDKKNILNFVIGEDYNHPIEHCLDSIEGKDHRYETFETFIYDGKHQEKESQDADYVFFYKETDKLRVIIQEEKKISGGEILRMCEELAEIAPTSVKLPSAPFDFKGEPPAELKKLFGVKGKLKYGDMKRDSSDEE